MNMNFLWSAEEREKLMSPLPPNKQSPGIIMEEGDLQEYLIFFIGSVMFFIQLNYAVKQYMIYTENATYMSKDEGQRKNYVQPWVSNIHVIILIPLVVYHILTWECEIDPTPLSFIKNDTCFQSVSKFGVKNILFSGGYFFYDLFYISFFSGPGGDLRVQT